MKTRRVLASAAIVGLGLIAAGHIRAQVTPRAEVDDRLIGPWRLVSAEASRGAHPTGFMSYDRTGFMTTQLMPDLPRPHFAGNEPTPDESKAALTGYLAYWGTYRVDRNAGTLVVHRLGSINPGDVGRDFVRRYSLIGNDKLVFAIADTPDRQLIWERIK
jgi:hypothetical protein